MNRRSFMRLCGMGAAGVAVGGVATKHVADHFTRHELRLAYDKLGKPERIISTSTGEFQGKEYERVWFDEKVPEGMFSEESFLKAVCRGTGKPTRGWVGDRALAAWERSQA